MSTEDNIDDYIIPADDLDMQQYVNMINVFTVYFKKLFEKKNSDNMFTNIDYTKENSTNRCMEYLFEGMHKLKLEKVENKKEIYNPKELKIDDCTELYVLYIDDEPNKVCQYLLPLIWHVGTLKWCEINWKIMPIKTNN